jgi:hypothetical protein
VPIQYWEQEGILFPESMLIRLDKLFAKKAYDEFMNVEGVTGAKVGLTPYLGDSGVGECIYFGVMYKEGDNITSALRAVITQKLLVQKFDFSSPHPYGLPR